jgi:hypothetical protein
LIEVKRAMEIAGLCKRAKAAKRLLSVASRIHLPDFSPGAEGLARWLDPNQ